MLFGSLFKGEKGIAVGRRKRKLTVADVIGRLDKFELTTANCTLIRDDLGNENHRSCQWLVLHWHAAHCERQGPGRDCRDRR